MQCPRCQGLMLENRLIDTLDEVVFAEAWKCLNCGEIVDKTIMNHRRIRMRELKKTLNKRRCRFYAPERIQIKEA